ncbi:winged helix-turn-helix transcriptional regulator [Robiginitalea sp. IMCC43444]|uniref:winged helix-turn-helix transcriptional regulator n=1 Tax=Robiginitalea sp. IMCC43444 TaxID=3459121 RepID=UPI0040430ECB
MILDNKEKVYRINNEIFHCGTAVGFSFIGGKWKSIILWYLRNGKLRFSEIKRLIPDVTDKMLSIQLSALESNDLVKRKKFGKKPPFRVEYSLTELGESLIPIIALITEWGNQYAENNGELIDN